MKKKNEAMKNSINPSPKLKNETFQMNAPGDAQKCALYAITLDSAMLLKYAIGHGANLELDRDNNVPKDKSSSLAGIAAKLADNGLNENYNSVLL